MAGPIGVETQAELAPARAADAAAVLGPQVPRLAAEWALGGDEPWRVLDGSLVFADISGFTALSERLAKQGPIGAEELTEVLGTCFAELLALAYAGGGSLLKFGGDALLLLFDGDGHAQRAVDAALGMRSAMRRVGRLTTSVGNVRLRMSLGVHSGELHAFRVGGSHRELLLVGPGASTVVSMEGTAEAGEIVVSPATASRIDARLLAGGKGPGVLLRPRAEPASSSSAAAAIGTFPVRATVDGEVAASVPVALREHLLAGGGESEHRSASIAFLHFDGTDELLAAHGPAWLASALDRLVRDVQQACESHGVTFLGSDLDHDGGKLILVGGVPRTLGDDEGRLLRAVREIVEGERDVPVRIGVNRGPVFAGEVGPSYRRTFTVMGDAVNLAARLMAKAAPGQVLASAGVLERSRTSFSTSALEPFFVKGKSKPVQAFSVGAAVGTQETRRSARLPFVGREAELDVLTSALETARRDGRGRVVDIVGDVGVGKSRLLEEARAVAAGLDVERRLVQCEQYDSATPFFAIGLLVTAVLGGRDDLPARIAAVAPALVPWAALVGDVVGVQVPESASTRDLAPSFRRSRTNEVVVELLSAALAGPAMLAFEDVHWMDAASAETLEAVTAVVHERPWLVVCTRRSGAGAGTTMVLPPLASDEATRLVRAATADAPITPARCAALVARADGNALFLEELLAFDRAAPGDDEAVLPESVEAVISLQVDRLPVGDGRLLRIAAVLGSNFDRHLLAAVAGADLEGPIDASLDALAEHLVIEADGRVRFRHRLLRDVAYGQLPFRRRKELHGRAADAIVHLANDASRSVDEVLSVHTFHAQRYAACRRHAVTAGDRAKKRHAPVEAGILFERAVQAARRESPALPPATMASLWSRLGTVRLACGDYVAADAAFTQAHKLRPGAPVHAAKMAIRRAEIAERQGRVRSEARWVARGLRSLEGRPGPVAATERAHLLNAQAVLRWRLGKPKEALRLAREAAAEGERAGPRGRNPLATAYSMMDVLSFSLGRPRDAVHGEAALTLYRQTRDRHNAANLLNNLGAFAYFEGRWTEALARYEEARRNFERIGNHVDAAIGRANIAEIFADQGRLDEAEQLLQEVIAVWRSTDFAVGLARATRYLGRVQLRRGDAGAALERFDEARATFASTGLLANVHEVDVWRAECLLLLGRVDEAADVLDVALAQELSSGNAEMRAMIHRLRAAVALARDDTVTAWAELDESLAVARARGAGYDVALALELLAVTARLGGRPDDPDARRERDELLRSLGVVAPPAPPLPRSV